MSYNQLSVGDSSETTTTNLTLSEDYGQNNGSYASNITDYSTDNHSVPSTRQYSSDQGDPLIYIVGVLSFYIVSITVLLLKYVRTQRQEEIDEYYYNAFVKREGLGLGPHGNRMTMDLTGKQRTRDSNETDKQMKSTNWEDIPSTSGVTIV